LIGKFPRPVATDCIQLHMLAFGLHELALDLHELAFGLHELALGCIRLNQIASSARAARIEAGRGRPGQTRLYMLP
jgi:hypothetical protein